MPRLIDANKLKTKAIADPDSGEGIVYVQDIDEAPTVDAVEVVRCKDCRFSAQHDPYDPMECVKWATKWGVVYTTPDGYCHKGERKDNV